MATWAKATCSKRPGRFFPSFTALVITGVALGLSMAPGNAAEGPARAPRPNIVLILADDLGWSDLGCQGSKYYETPHIDQMAAEGMRFTQGYACGPNCQPTRACLMSGQYGPRTGIYTVGSIDRFDSSHRPLAPVPNVQALPLDKITIAQSLKAGGYATGMFGKWHLGQDGEHHPARRGFDEAIVSMGKHFDFKTDPKVPVDPRVYLADFLTDRAVEFIEKHRQEPFFLYLPHFAVHSPHEAKEELIAHFKPKPPVGGHNSPVYAGMIASVDQSVGRVLAQIDHLQLAQRTLVIFTSDNGGVGGYERAGLPSTKGITDNAPLRGGKGMLYEGGIREPYVFRWKGTIAPASRCDLAINSVDLYPTLLEVAGVPRPAGVVLDGVSYLPLLTGGDSRVFVDRALYWHFPGYLGGGGPDAWRTTPAGAIHQGDYKLLEFFEDGHLELYDLKNDLGEEHNLATQRPELAQQLHEKLVAWRTAIKAPMPERRTEPAATPKAGKRAKRRGPGKAE